MPVKNPTARESVVWAFHPDAQAWRDVGITSAADAGEWSQAGFDPKAAALWQSCGYRPAQAAEMLELGARRDVVGFREFMAELNGQEPE